MSDTATTVRERPSPSTSLYEIYAPDQISDLIYYIVTLMFYRPPHFPIPEALWVVRNGAHLPTPREYSRVEHGG